MATGNTVVRIKLNPDHSIEGYHAKDREEVRHRALRRAIKDRGHVKLIRRLNVLYIYNKHRFPRTAATFRGDMRYVQELYEKCKHKATFAKSRREAAAFKGRHKNTKNKKTRRTSDARK